MNDSIKVLVATEDHKKVLDPSKVNFVSQYQILDNMTRRLFKFGDHGGYEFDLAESFSIEENEILVRIKISKYSDGRQIFSDDVIRSFQRVLKLGSPHTDPASVFDNSDPDHTFTRIDSLTFRAKINKLPKSYKYFFQMVDYAILTPEQQRKQVLTPEDWKISSGPYSVKSFHNEFVIKKNQHYPNIQHAPSSAYFYQADENRINELLKGEYDLAKVQYGYLDDGKKLEMKSQGVTVIPNRYNFIVYINLNPADPQFKRSEVRQWLRSRLLERLDLPTTKLSEKAPLYFLPGSVAYSEAALALTRERAKKMSNLGIPPELKDGIHITSTKNMWKYYPRGLEGLLTESLGIQVKIDLTDSADQMMAKLKTRTYGAYLMANSMSYNETSETLNLLYKGNAKEHLDPSKKISGLIEELARTNSNEIEIYNKINIQMFEDSENIPLCYTASPIIYNSERIKPHRSDLIESLQIWRMATNE